MEEQIKRLFERFEQRILTYIKKECTEFIQTYDEKMLLYDPSKSIFLKNDIIKVIFNEIYSCGRDYVRAQTHGPSSLEKIYVCINHLKAKTNTICELSVGKGFHILAQGDSNSINKLKTVIELLISDAGLRDTIRECYRLLRQLIKVGRENEIYQLNYIEWLPIAFFKDVVYSPHDDLPDRIMDYEYNSCR